MKKNIILILADQLRFDGLGCAGNPYARTPCLDALAAEATLFTRHVAANPICMPSRASLMTGLYPPGHNVWANGVSLPRHASELLTRAPTGDPVVLPDVPTLADVCADAGYDTASFGKLHFTPYAGRGNPESFHGARRRRFRTWHGPYYGFQHVELTLGHGERPCYLGHYSLWLRKHHPRLFRRLINPARVRQRHLPIPSLPTLFTSPLPAEAHHSAWLAQQLGEYIQRRQDSSRPFFAFLGFPDPHHPFTPCEDVIRDFEAADVLEPDDPEGRAVAQSPPWQIFDQRFDTTHLTPEERRIIRRYTAAMVHQIDRAVGRVVEAVRNAGIWDDTIFIFTSDHGDFLGDHGRLGKGQIGCHSLLRIPFLMRAPDANLPPRVDTPMSNADVLPTVARLAGLEPPPALHGRDLLEILANGEDHRAMAFCSRGQPETVNFTIYDRTHRLTLYPHLGFRELFDHAEDPGECTNLAEDHGQRSRVEDLTRALADSLLRFHNPMLGRTCKY